MREVDGLVADVIVCFVFVVLDHPDGACSAMSKAAAKHIAQCSQVLVPVALRD